jgi:hypothetical protein
VDDAFVRWFAPGAVTRVGPRLPRVSDRRTASAWLHDGPTRKAYPALAVPCGGGRHPWLVCWTDRVHPRDAACPPRPLGATTTLRTIMTCAAPGEPLTLGSRGARRREGPPHAITTPACDESSPGEWLMSEIGKPAVYFGSWARKSASLKSRRSAVEPISSADPVVLVAQQRLARKGGTCTPHPQPGARGGAAYRPARPWSAVR